MAGALALNLGSVPPQFHSTVRFPGSRRPMQAMAFAVAAAPAAPAAPAAAPSKNLYEMLRIKETASASEIKIAYRSLAKKFHPDAAGSGVGQDYFVEINRAYTTLSDPSARALYDSSIRRFRFSGETPRFPTRRWETDQCW